VIPRWPRTSIVLVAQISQQRLQVASEIQKFQQLHVGAVADEFGTAALQHTKTSSPRMENKTTAAAPSQMNEDDTNAKTKTSKDASKSMKASASASASAEVDPSDTSTSDKSKTNGTTGTATNNSIQARVPIVSKTHSLIKAIEHQFSTQSGC
jgi:hypothetical protein